MRNRERRRIVNAVRNRSEEQLADIIFSWYVHYCAKGLENPQSWHWCANDTELGWLNRIRIAKRHIPKDNWPLILNSLPTKIVYALTPILREPLSNS